MKLSKSLIVSTIVLSMFSPISAFATTGTITFALPATSAANIPTLSGTMLVILSLLLFVIALRVTKQKNLKNGKYFILFIGIAMTGVVTTGLKLIPTASAGIPSVTVQITNGSSVTYTDITYARYDNYSGNPLTIGIQVKPGSFCRTDSDNPCIDGGTLEADSSCDLICTVIPPIEDPS